MEKHKKNVYTLEEESKNEGKKRERDIYEKKKDR